jgi:hypothetical protein
MESRRGFNLTVKKLEGIKRRGWKEDALDGDWGKVEFVRWRN